MKQFTKLLVGTAVGLTLALGAAPSYAATPDNMLVIANRIDDITTLDPAESFEFAGSDVSRNVYGKLVNFNPLDGMRPVAWFDERQYQIPRLVEYQGK